MCFDYAIYQSSLYVYAIRGKMSGHELHSTDVRNFDNSYNDAHAVGISHFLEIGEFCPNIVEYIAHEDTIS